MYSLSRYKPSPSADERIWHMQDSRGQILALGFEIKVLVTFSSGVPSLDVASHDKALLPHVVRLNQPPGIVARVFPVDFV